MIEIAVQKDIREITFLAKKARNHMLDIGLKQWVGDYPNLSNFSNDLKVDCLYVYRNNNSITGAISLLPDTESVYREIKWSTNNALVIHRLIVDPESQRKGIGKSLFEFSINLAKERNYQSIKVDTHPDNFRMLGLIIKMGFKYVGYLTTINRLAYELEL